MLENLRYTDPQSRGILALNTQTGIEVYLRPGSLLYDIAVSGTFGAVAAYVEPPKPEEPPAFATKAEALVAMVAWLEEFTEPLVADTPLKERMSWATKEDAARAYLAGTASAEQLELIEGEAAITAEALADLAALILERAAVIRPVASAVAGLRRKAALALDAVTDPYQYEVVLLAAREEAKAHMISLGLGSALGLEAAGA